MMGKVWSLDVLVDICLIAREKKVGGAHTPVVRGSRFVANPPTRQLNTKRYKLKLSM